MGDRVGGRCTRCTPCTPPCRPASAGARCLVFPTHFDWFERLVRALWLLDAVGPQPLVDVRPRADVQMRAAAHQHLPGTFRALDVALLFPELRERFGGGPVASGKRDEVSLLG